MRGGGGQKMFVFVHAQGIKTVHPGGGGSKISVFVPAQDIQTVHVSMQGGGWGAKNGKILST